MKTYSEKLKDPRWQKKRLEVFERAGWMCQLCGSETSTLHVHHPKYARAKEPWEYENLISLCENCHSNTHKNAPASALVAPPVFFPKASRSAGDDLVAVLWSAPQIRQRVLDRLDRDWIEAAPKTNASVWLMEFIKENALGEIDAANSFQAFRETEYCQWLAKDSNGLIFDEKVAIEAIRSIRSFALLKRARAIEKEISRPSITDEQAVEFLKQRDALQRENASPISI